ncbi:thiamine pyrophosphate-dependent enzyme [Streptomyces sp. NPDC001185]|uniref:thiamine pyrophosphate-dependent enzyme n=1 Tax=Streptomyces sp. NPDC001185 TaxID=3154380 RepID=UPI003325867A
MFHKRSTSQSYTYRIFRHVSVIDAYLSASARQIRRTGTGPATGSAGELGPAPEDGIRRAARLIRDAERPALLVGLRGADPAASAALRALVDGTDLPVVETFQAAGPVSREQRTALLRIDEQARAETATEAGLNPAAVALKVRELVDATATVVCDVGSHYIFMARHFRSYQPGHLLFSNGQQTLGVALPRAMAAAMVRPRTQILSVSGDGGRGLTAHRLPRAEAGGHTVDRWAGRTLRRVHGRP